MLDQFNQWLAQLIAESSVKLSALQTSLTERLLPLIEQFRPIWEDPLWQALALILAIVVGLYFAGWFISTANQVLVYLFGLFGSAGEKAYEWLKKPFVWFAERFGKLKQNHNKARWQWASMGQVRRAVNAMKYLTTRRDWRYSTQWFLLIGEQNSGKTALVKAVTENRRVQLLPREKNMRDPGSGWHFFDHALVIEQDNKCATHDQDSEVDGDQEQQDAVKQQNRFRYLIELLHWYRPERAIDGIILTISAKSLLEASEPAALQQLGNTLFEQLWQSQKHSGFVLPVYMVITHCDEVEGFESFWQAQGEQRFNEMIGWSNPYRLDSAFTKDWVDEAFAQVLVELQDAQLQVAASGQNIENIDSFMLFRQQFAELHQPLSEVTNSAFARSSFQEAMPLRGIYFCGKVKGKVEFVNDLMMEKVFAEKHLAFPLEKRRFSTQKTLRRAQIGSVVAAVFLIGLMGVDSVRLENYTVETEENLRRLMQVQQDCSGEGLDTYRLLDGLTAISDRPLLLSLPASWFGTQADKEQRLVADQVFKTTMFKSLECRLKIRAERLRSDIFAERGAQDYREVIHDLKTFGSLLEDFELNRERFLQLAGPIQDQRDIGRIFAPLLQYLYDRPIPPSVDPHAELITGAIAKLDYNVKWDEKGKGLVSRENMLDHLDNLSQQLHQALIAHAQKLPLTQLREVSINVDTVPMDKMLPASPLLKDIKLFQHWLDETRKDWLAATAQTSPCGKIHQNLVGLRRSLVKVGFDQDDLDAIVARFSQSNCDHQVRKKLAELHVPPFGNMFVRNNVGRLIISPQLQRLATQIKALDDLGYVNNSYPPVTDSAEPVVGWAEVPLQELLGILRNYQQFDAEHSQGDKPFFANALINRLAQVTHRSLNAAAIRPSQLPAKEVLIADPIAYNESALDKSVSSFKAVSGQLLQIGGLLKQLGDNGNSIRLQQMTQTFILQQLQRLEQLVADNRLYQPVAEPRWDERNFTNILFNLDTDKQIASYLTSQRQRISFIAFGYAEPLIRYLQNSDTGLSDKLVRRWMDTLADLDRYQRSEPNDQISQLDFYINDVLVSLNNDNCFEQAQDSSKDHLAANAGWFATRKLQLQRQLTVQCQDAGDNKVINRYLAIRDRFNRQLAGKFPFADINMAGAGDAEIKTVRRFFEQYRLEAKTLLADLNKVAAYQPGSIPLSWRDFISQMNNLSEFFGNNWDNKSRLWQVPLNVEFAAMANRANGTNQIIQWILTSGAEQISYPNGGNKLVWQVGDPLSLGLRWAIGSAFVPLEKPGTLYDAPLQIDSQQQMATFSSRGRWGLFEWLARYSAYDMNNLNTTGLDEKLLAFHVPVVLKTSTIKPLTQAYVSRANLLVWVEVINADGDTIRMPLPGTLPAAAPGFND